MTGFMPAGNHVNRFRPALRLLRFSAQCFKLIGRRLQEDLIVIYYENIDLIKPDFIQLSVGCRDIQHDGEGRPLALLALTVNRPSHQVDHLLCNGQAKAGSLDAVDAAVCLP